MSIVFDDKGNAVTEFPNISGVGRVIPVTNYNSDGTNTVHIEQHVQADDNNSSTTNLSSSNSYTFTGVGTSTLGVAGIQVSLHADQNCIVKVEQSPDNINWDLSDTYYYMAHGDFGITVQAISSYARVIVVTASLTTTEFRLQTALCPIVEAVPRSLDGNGNFKIATPMDDYGFKSENSPTGDARFVEPSRLIGASFDGSTIDSRFWTTAAAGTSAAITQANAQILLTSGTSNAATVTMYSLRRARYVGGYNMRYRSVVQINAGLADNKRRWGIGFGSSMPTVTDGAWFQMNGTTFQVVTCKATTQTPISTFNGQLGPSYTPSTGALVYEIYWSNSKVWFTVDGKILHTVTASAATWSSTMNFHIFADSVNSAVIATNRTLAIRTNTIHRLGKLETQPTSYYFASGQTAETVLKLGSGVLHALVFGSAVNNSVITLYDNTAASGTILWVSTIANSSSMPITIDFKAMPFFVGLSFKVATQNASFTAIYE